MMEASRQTGVMSVRALNLYYARDENARAPVLATRLRATDVRETIGVARGRVFVRAAGDGDLPDVMWDCAFADAGAHDLDMRTRAASAEFEACRAVMRTLTRRFERVIYAQAVHAAALAVSQTSQMMQIWMSGDTRSAPSIEALRSTPAAALLQRTDDNRRLPDWIIEMAVNEDEHAIASWIARQSHTEATIVRWDRVA
jgi:hypothetical protein